MRRGLWFVVTASAACGGVQGLEQPDAPQLIDADAPDNRACDPSKPFDPPVALTELNSTGVDGNAWLSTDLLTIYFDSSRTGGPGDENVYYATRGSVTSAFGPPAVLPNVNSDQRDGTPVVSLDGLTMYFSSTRTGGGDIYVATRSDTSAAFGAPSLLLNVNDATNEDAATHINAAGTTLYISSLRTNEWDMFRATRAGSTGAFSAATPIGELNVSATEDYGAVLTGDELTVYFESTRTGTIGCYDVFRATRSTTNDGFGTPVQIPELSTTFCEWPTWLSPDGCQILLTSNRTGTAGGHDIWLAKKPL